jgi:hypothetical protein
MPGEDQSWGRRVRVRHFAEAILEMMGSSCRARSVMRSMTKKGNGSVPVESRIDFA